MSDSWKEREKALEDQYFDKLNKAALSRLQNKEARRSPITGDPMEQITVLGVNVDRCKTSGGIWLDAGELEEILNKSKEKDNPAGNSWVQSFFDNLFKTKS